MDTTEKTDKGKPDRRDFRDESGQSRHKLERGEPALRSLSEGGFSPAALFAQLSRLLALYLKRAEDTDALDKLAPKDALACAKTVMAMMADLQGGKPASVDEHTQWPRLELGFTAGGAGVSIGGAGVSIGGAGVSIGGAGVSPVIPHNRRGTGPRPTGSSSRYSPPATRYSGAAEAAPISSLEDAIVAVCRADEETQALEPWARLLTRIDELCVRIQQDLDDWRESSGAEEWDPGDNGEPPAEQILSLPRGDGRSIPSPPEFGEPAGDDEASENDDGNDQDFPARHNPRGP